MAIRPRQDSGVTVVRGFPALHLEDGKLPESEAVRLSAAISELVAAVNSGISLGTGQHARGAGSLDAQWVEVVVPVANVEVTIPHGLGRVPAGVLLSLPDTLCRVAATHRASWTSSKVFITSDVAGITFKLLLF